METHNETYRTNNENIPGAVKPMEAKHTSAWERLLAQMIEGTEQAIADAALQKTRYTLTNGSLEKTAPGGSRYRFQAVDEWEPRANTSLQIELDPDHPDHTVAGTALAIQNTSITLVTEQPLPQALLSQVTCCPTSAHAAGPIAPGRGATARSSNALQHAKHQNTSCTSGAAPVAPGSCRDCAQLSERRVPLHHL